MRKTIPQYRVITATTGESFEIGVTNNGRITVKRTYRDGIDGYELVSEGGYVGKLTINGLGQLVYEGDFKAGLTPNLAPTLSDLVVLDAQSDGTFKISYIADDINGDRVFHYLKVGNGEFEEIIPSGEGRNYIYKGKGLGLGKHRISVRVSDGSLVSDTEICDVIIPSPIINVEGVLINEREATLVVGSTRQFTEVVIPSNATDKSVEWFSSNPSVISVNENGLATAVGRGSATVNVKTINGGFIDKCNINVEMPVVNVTDIILNKKEITLWEGFVETLIPQILPSNASNQDIIWTSSDIATATVNKVGEVYASSIGECTITATTVDGEKTAECKVRVVTDYIEVETVTLNHSENSIKVGDIFYLQATIVPTYATDKNVVWSSSNTNVATVNEYGRVEAIGIGSTVIQVDASNDKYARCRVNVIDEEIYIPVEEITLNKKQVELNVEQQTTLVATIKPTNATNNHVTWYSSNVSVADVDENGVVTAFGSGFAEIIASSLESGVEATCTVVVNGEDITRVIGVEIVNKIEVVEIGETIALEALVNPSNATNKEVMWDSSDSEVMVITDSEGSAGVMVAQSVGVCTISVTTLDGGYEDTCTIEVIETEI